MKNKNRAFSLIELSIVVLIIGILIAGVTQGSRLVNASKVQTAQTLTQSSPVTSISGLALWLETSRDASFISTQTSNATALTKWYDTNPQSTNNFNHFTSASASTTYKTIGINGLPSVSFVGTAASTPYFSGTISPNALSPIKTPYSAYTVFVVARVTNISAANTIFYNGTFASNDGFGIQSSAAGKVSVIGGTSFDATAGTASAVANAARIMVATISPNSALGATATQVVSTYVNGTKDGTTTLTGTPVVTPTVNMYIGNKAAGSAVSDPFIGDISEIIMFDTVLKASDRQAVEQYLGKKYGIAVNVNANY